MSESSLSDDCSSVWEVQDILAQRFTLSGEIEYLVVWRSTWSAADLVKDGPVLRHWLAAKKFKSGGAMAVTLPVVRGTQLYSDCRILRQRAAQRAAPESPRLLGSACVSTLVPAPVPRPSLAVGPRKQLGSSAKRVRPD
jgi:hypothetical protein